MTLDMRMPGIGGEAQAEAGSARLIHERNHPGQDCEAEVELPVALPPLGLQGRPVSPFFERMPWVEGKVGVPDAPEELRPVKRDPVGRVDVRVGVYHGRLGVENQAVEVKNQGEQGLQAVQNGIAEAGCQRDSGPMNRSHAVAVIAMAMVSCAFADPDQFSRIVKPADFAAAGLSKLSPEELARLDQLVESYKSGALETARQQAAAASAAQAAAEARASQAEAEAKTAQAAEAREKEEASAQAASAKKASGGGILSRAIVLITPGTKVAYQSVEGRILGKVNGWEAHTVFTLENGTRWEVSDYSHYNNGGSVNNPKVKLTPVGTWGGFRMEIEDIGEVRVRLISEPQSAAGPPPDAK